MAFNSERLAEQAEARLNDYIKAMERLGTDAGPATAGMIEHYEKLAAQYREEANYWLALSPTQIEVTDAVLEPETGY